MLGNLGMGLLLGYSSVETTPVFSTFAVVTHEAGGCAEATVSPSAVLRLSWTVANPTPSYKVYQDDILLDAVSDSPYDITLRGRRVDGADPTTYAWVFRVDAILSSGAVGASATEIVTRALGGCSAGPEPE